MEKKATLEILERTSMNGSVIRREPMSGGASLSDMVMGFFEEVDHGEMREISINNNYSDDEGESSSNGAEDKEFWDTQYQDLQEILGKESSAEKRIRTDTEGAVNKMKSEGLKCKCANRTMKEHCRNCALLYVTDRLRETGYNSALCKSKWNRSPDIPSGEHSYVDVVVDSKTGKRNPIRVVIELNFRAEFEMARASNNYKTLVETLPELFVGKPEKLKHIVKIMCDAAKKCMKDNKMHMGPWRKHKYMLSKWLSTPERITSGPFIPAADTVSKRQDRKLIKASMLTFDLHCTAVEVV